MSILIFNDDILRWYFDNLFFGFLKCLCRLFLCDCLSLCFDAWIACDGVYGCHRPYYTFMVSLFISGLCCVGEKCLQLGVMFLKFGELLNGLGEGYILEVINIILAFGTPEVSELLFGPSFVGRLEIPDTLYEEVLDVFIPADVSNV